MRPWLALSLFWATLSGCAEAQSPIEVVDGRRAGEGDDLHAWATQPPVQWASDAAAAYWRGRDSGFEEELQVMAVADGAFTRAGAAQQAVLYLKSRWPRCCPKMGLAVIEDGRLVHAVTFEGVAQELTAVPDLDGDGRDELAYVGEFGMGGQASRSVTLVAFRDEGLVEWGGTALSDSDCAGSGQAGSTAARVLATPGPAFTVERYAQPSCEAEAWESAGGPEPLALDPPGETAYVALPVE